MGIFNRWSSKKENDEAKEKRAASVIKIAKEIKKEDVKVEEKKKEVKEPKKEVNQEKETKVAGEKEATDAYRVLIHPVITEKSTFLQSDGIYVFEVFTSATKVDIRKAVQSLYKVKVTGVRIVNLKGKQVRFGRVQGKRKARKKAMVTLQKGQSIELHKNV